MPITRSCTRCGRKFVEYEDTTECPICENRIEKSVFLNSKNQGDEMAKHRKRKKRKDKPENKAATNTSPQAKGGDVVVYSATGRDDSWEVELDTVNQCGKAPKETIVWFEPIVKSKIDALMDEYKSIEWLAYLVGKLDMNDMANIVVEDLAIPSQEITSTSVDNIHMEEFNDLNIIGVIHSHHGMGNSFSGTDNDWINQNHKISLCVATNGIKGHLRWKTPCGALMTIEAKCKLRYDVDFNKEEFIKGAKEKIKKKSYTYAGAGYGAGGVYGGGFNYNRDGYGWSRGGWQDQTPRSSYVGSGSIKEAAAAQQKSLPVDTAKNTELENGDAWSTENDKKLNSDDAPSFEDLQEEETLVQALTEYEKSIVESGI